MPEQEAGFNIDDLMGGGVVPPEEDPQEEPEEVEEEEVEEEPEVEEAPPTEETPITLETISQIVAEALKNHQNQQQTQEPEEEEPAPEPVTFDSLFEDEEEFAQAVSTQEGFTAVAKKIADVIQENIFRSIPSLVAKAASEHIATQTTVQNFYAKNPELTDQKDIVAVAAQRVQSKNPDKPFESLLDEVAAEARNILKIDKKAEQIDRKPNRTTGGRGNRPKGTSGTKTVADEVAELID